MSRIHLNTGAVLTDSKPFHSKLMPEIEVAISIRFGVRTFSIRQTAEGFECRRLNFKTETLHEMCHEFFDLSLAHRELLVLEVETAVNDDRFSHIGLGTSRYVGVADEDGDLAFVKACIFRSASKSLPDEHAAWCQRAADDLMSILVPATFNDKLNKKPKYKEYSDFNRIFFDADDCVDNAVTKAEANSELIDELFKDLGFGLKRKGRV